MLTDTRNGVCRASVTAAFFRIVATTSLLILPFSVFTSPFIQTINVNPTHFNNSNEPTNINDFKLLAYRRQPILLRNLSLIQQWRALNWSISRIEKYLPVVPVYEQHQSNEFITFHDSKPLEGQLSTAKWSDFNLKQNRTMYSLFAKQSMSCVPYFWDFSRKHSCSIPNRDAWYYFSSRTELLGDFWPDLQDDINTSAFQITNTGIQSNVWIGNAGLVTHTHYDASWNFFVQLHGIKEFALISSQTSLPLYPCLHPHIGHTPLSLLESKKQNLFRSVLEDNIVVHIARLHPGDVLIIPPMWFHQ